MVKVKCAREGCNNTAVNPSSNHWLCNTCRLKYFVVMIDGEIKVATKLNDIPEVFR